MNDVVSLHRNLPIPMMTEQQIAAYWDQNAAAWTALARAGYDTYRDLINTPAFLSLLPPIHGLKGIDIGCGEGHNTRLLADLGADMTGIDLSAGFILAAMQAEQERGGNIRFVAGSALQLPFPDGYFDFATGFMSFMDMPDIGGLFREAARVLKPGGFLQFSISHPCFNPAGRSNIKDESGITYALEINDYFTEISGVIEERLFNAVPREIACKYPKFQIPRFTHTLSAWLNSLIENGFVIDRLHEPQASPAMTSRHPELTILTKIPYFLHIRCVKQQEASVSQRAE